MSELLIADAADRETLGAFVARAVRLDGQSFVRLRERPGAGIVEAWASTPFEVLATRAVPGHVIPADITVSGNELLAALTVVGGPSMDPGPARDIMWHSELPRSSGWQLVDELPAIVVADLADRGVTLAKDNVGPHGTPPASLMDQSVLTVSGENLEVKVQLRCLFALSGMGFLDSSIENDVVRVTANDSWMRLDARYGAVLKRRHALLPLLF